MICECGGKLGSMDVIDTGDEIHRYRKCEKCGRKAYTSEIELTSNKDWLELCRQRQRLFKARQVVSDEKRKRITKCITKT